MFRSIAIACCVLTLVAALLAAPASAKYSSNSVRITEDSVEGRNVQAAADFLRDMGNPERADNILEFLRAGRLYYDETLKENGDTDTTGWSKDITLTGSLAHPGTNREMRSKPLDYANADRREFGSILDLARVLYHEKVHAHQWMTLHCWGNVLTWSQTHEFDAWTETIMAMQGWVKKSREALDRAPSERRMEALKRHRDILAALASYLGDFIDNGCFGGTRSVWEEIRGTYNDSLKDVEREIRRLEGEPEGDEEEEEVGLAPLPDRQKLDEMALAAAPVEFACEDVLVSLAGQDRAAGHVFDCTVRNLTDRPLVGEIPWGLVVIPSDARYQRMILGDSVAVTVAPRSETTVPLEGFCLDHDRLPPPKGTTVTWTPPRDHSPYFPLILLLEAGNRLARSGAYASDIQEPKRYRNTVIERALWYYQTRGTPDEVGKQRLREDTDAQLARLPEERRPPPEERDKVVDRIWDDVDLTLKEQKQEQPGTVPPDAR